MFKGAVICSAEAEGSRGGNRERSLDYSLWTIPCNPLSMPKW